MDNRKKSPLDVEYTSGGIFNAKKLSTHTCTGIGDSKIKVGLEATGHYSYNILGFLLDNGLPKGHTRMISCVTYAYFNNIQVKHAVLLKNLILVKPPQS